jgi:hypothetical protein
MRRRVIMSATVAALAGVTGLTACTSESEELTISSTPTSAGSSVSSAGGADPATSTTGGIPTRTPSTRVSVVTANIIPEAYRGRWNSRPADCRGDSGEGRLVVEARRMAFYESVGQVIAVTPQKGRISITLMLSGEGQTWQDTRVWKLSPDGETLTDVTHAATRVRCP